ncbi:hypothetical protein ACQBAU_16380 [Propionibacteriaceae bacterium Y2011]
MNIGLYAKAIAGAVVAGLTAATTALADGTITLVEWMVIAGAFLAAAAAVWAVPTLPEGVARYGKIATSALIALAGSLGTGLADGALSSQEIITAVIALLVGSGLVASVPNAAGDDPADPVTRKLVPVSTATKAALVTGGRSYVGKHYATPTDSEG